MYSKLSDCSVAEHGYAVLTAETPSYNSKATDTKPIYSINPLTDIDCQQESGSGVIDLQVSPTS